ncbi:unnamed protein product (macronuclear) [Paramecium tetraurelia]|uniref:RING-type domain-containing protein n=1 Tax=Paramecium tetraurelia TaxID=5888 RepID=A0D7X7_PARTE|nr:uncharacterized protein GSPATT00014111001 [Paramecium tetraurelia]CAK79144.1 unnamed protein product [Paramecium tetraurelia]|eukprot:XP_001446541.1 hypothetical protein (macronuclear) [Paramecium tetraurelia strain d4-2]
MHFYILFIEIVFGSHLYTRSNGSVENQIFRECSYSGSNSDHYLFQCIQDYVFVPKLELAQKQVDIKWFIQQIGIYSFERNGEIQLSNYVICQIITTEGQKTLEIRRTLYTQHSNLIKKENNLMFYDLTQIDSLCTMVSLLKRQGKQDYLIEMHPIYPGNVNQFQNISYKFNSDDDRSIFGFSQSYNKIRNALLLIVLKQNQIQLIEYSLFDNQFREASTYPLSENKVPLNWKVWKSGYIIITYEQFQVLYSIGETLYEIQEIYWFDQQPLQMITNFDGTDSKYILQQNMNYTKIFIIEEIQYQYQSKSVRLIQKIDFQYSNIAFLLDETELILIYDQFETAQVHINHIIMDQFQFCQYDIEELPQMNLESIKYQQSYHTKISLYPNEVKLTENCSIPCDLIYEPLNISLIPHKSECIFESLYNEFLNGCNKFNSCYACMQQTGCEWIDDICQTQQNYEGIDLNQVKESSKWFVNKILKCGQEIEFNQTYYGNVSKGTVFTLFHDATTFQEFNLDFNLQVEQQSNMNFIQQSICLGNELSQLCDEILINHFNSDFRFKGYYFRITFVILENIKVSDLSVTIKSQDSLIDSELYRIYKLIGWLCLAIILFGTIIYLANKRMNYLIQLSLQNNQHSLDTESLYNVMEQMIKDKVIVKERFSQQILKYDEDKCPFCIEKYEIKQDIIQIFCGHTFHLDCFEDWVRINTKLVRCPICNQTIEHFLKNQEQFKKSTNV